MFETTSIVTVFLAASAAVGVSLLLWRTPASSLTRATETAQYCLHLPRRAKTGAMHACVVISLVLLSACPLSNADSIDAGQGHTCAITASGGVRCWGWNLNGQASAVYVWSAPASNILKFGHVRCVQLGDGTFTDRNTPTADVLTSVAAITAGGGHTCALTVWGGVRCWGLRTSGQASAVHAYVERSCQCALHSGHVCCDCVQLGDGSSTNRHTPSADVLTSVAAITTGVAHTCALTTSGGVRCWGWNTYGQASAVHAYVERSCQCILISGHVCCVQLGIGSVNGQGTPPTAHPDVLTSVTAITAGSQHTCALTTSGGVRCWGANDYGQASDVHASGAFLPVRTQFWSCLLLRRLEMVQSRFERRHQQMC